MSSRIESDPDPADVAFLEGRINDITQDRIGGDAPCQLAVFVRDAAGAITAGTYGWTWGTTCELHHLWVDESLRRTGVGTQLLAEVEAEATRRGCGQMIFFSHAFQAGHFYLDRGYEVVGRVEDYPDGDAALWLRKPLGAGDLV